MGIKIEASNDKSFWLCGFVLVFVLVVNPLQTRAQEAPEDGIVFQHVDPLVKVFRSTAVFRNHEARADVVRGQHATFQFAIRSNQRLENLHVSVGTLVDSSSSTSGRLDGAEVGYVGYVRAENLADDPAHDRLRPTSGYYPDPILEKPPATLRTDRTQPVWITIPIPTDTAPGSYEGTVVLTARVNSQPMRIERPITVKVHSPVVKDTRLWVTNWWRWHGIERTDLLSYMNGGNPVEPFSEQYWELIRSLAHTMAAYRQNVSWISPLELAQFEVEDGRYRIDFSRFDRMVELFIEAGVVGRIEGRHLAGRTSDWTSEIAVYVPDVRADTTVFEKVSITEERARSFLRQFIPALATHLKEKGWFDIYMQHIADEPIEANADSYIAIARFVKELAPDLRLIDATLYKSLKGVLDVWVPILEGFDQNYAFFKARQEAGDEVWFYTCVVPQGEYANRFIELPLIKTRLLHWINFRYGATGYLHWGFNHWGGDTFEEASERGLPAGDSWIVYPKEGRVIPSIRLEAMRQGIVDYELLMMLEERRPEAAHELVRNVVYGFKRYDTSVANFRRTRRRLLALLSETLMTEAR